MLASHKNSDVIQRVSGSAANFFVAQERLEGGNNCFDIEFFMNSSYMTQTGCGNTANFRRLVFEECQTLLLYPSPVLVIESKSNENIAY
jgi:hypothetical protein